jgi:hypothetical protein
MTADANRGDSLSPREILEQVAAAIPVDCRDAIVIIGSIAAGFHFFGGDRDVQMRTKDVDCLLTPRIRAVPVGRSVAERLRESGWAHRRDGRFVGPGQAGTPDAELPAVRLCPPGGHPWFVELLTVPESEADIARRFTRLVTDEGHFGLPSFGFLALTDVEPIDTEFGIRIARPEMMALANLLHHPTIATETMSGLIADRVIRRSNKDLGRVLALALLAESRDDDALVHWPGRWLRAMQARFPSTWQQLVPRTGAGLRLLLGDDHGEDLAEARHSCEFGILASRPPSLDGMKAAGRRLLADAVDPFERMARP